MNLGISFFNIHLLILFCKNVFYFLFLYLHDYEVFNVSHLMFSYENISFVYKVHSPQLNTERKLVEPIRVAPVILNLFQDLLLSLLVVRSSCTSGDALSNEFR